MEWNKVSCQAMRVCKFFWVHVGELYQRLLYGNKLLTQH